MSVHELLTHLGALAGGGGIVSGALALRRAQHAQAAAAHGERAAAHNAASADVTAGHKAFEVSERMLAALLSRLTMVETALHAEQDARRSERALSANELQALRVENAQLRAAISEITLRAEAAEKRADDADERAKRLFEEFEEYKRADRAKANSLPPRLEHATDVEDKL